MRKEFFVFALAVCAPVLIAQASMNNDSVIKLCKSGLSDDVIVTTINSSPGDYKTSADDLVALKTAGASDKVVAAVVTKAAAPAPAVAAAAESTGTAPVPSSGKQKPRVFLTSASHGTNKNAARDQSMEMAKDIEKSCPDVKVTINQNVADYTILLNHIEHGFSRDNQIQVANRDGDVISKAKEGGSINSNVKKACEIILADWAKK